MSSGSIVRFFGLLALGLLAHTLSASVFGWTVRVDLPLLLALAMASAAPVYGIWTVFSVAALFDVLDGQWVGVLARTLIALLVVRLHRRVPMNRLPQMWAFGALFCALDRLLHAGLLRRHGVDAGWSAFLFDPSVYLSLLLLPPLTAWLERRAAAGD